MKSNKWIDMWCALPLGQRRAIVVLLCVVVLLTLVQVAVNVHTRKALSTTADYTVLEDDIAHFRSQLDTIPEEERPPVYVRRTHARPDTTSTPSVPMRSVTRKKQKTTPQQPEVLQPIPRIDVDKEP